MSGVIDGPFEGIADAYTDQRGVYIDLESTYAVVATYTEPSEGEPEPAPVRLNVTDMDGESVEPYMTTDEARALAQLLIDAADRVDASLAASKKATT